MWPIRSLARKNFPLRSSLIKLFLIFKGKSLGIIVKFNGDAIDFIDNNNRIIRLSLTHILYGGDIIDSFNYYFSAVEAISYKGFQLVDYSTPRYHKVIGFDRHPIYFPSLSEPLSTTKQYLEFAELSEGSVALDLGAYSGLTSIIFKEMVGKTGTVLAMDADKDNYAALSINIETYRKATGNQVIPVYGAIWCDANGLEFSIEGNMGSSAVAIVGSNRGQLIKVPTFTLSNLVEKYNLQKVDFIKCDVEGAEAYIFQDDDFFKSFKPRIIIETHSIDGFDTTQKCIDDLSKHGYKFKSINQTGVSLPLLECHPL